MHKHYLKNNKSNQSFARFQSFQSQLTLLITTLRNKYYSKVAKKILDLRTSPKTYCSILETFLNNKKIHVIPSILHENEFITDFKQKAEIFNSHFSKQCILLKKSSIISSECPKQLNGCLSSITFETNDITKDIDPNKCQGHEILSTRMLTLCGQSIYKPLNLVFKSCLENC